MTIFILLASGFLIVGLWSLTALRLVLALRAIRPLSQVLEEGGWGVSLLGAAGAPEGRRGRDGPSRALPHLSVVVTALNEAERIEVTVRKLLAQRYAGLEIVVVDDRSTDGTGAILDRLLAERPDAAPHLEVIHNRSLPTGWVGKCHACHLGAERAHGEWILFTDGDVALEDVDLLAGVVAHAERHRIDHIAVVPDLRPMSAIQAGLVAAFGQVFFFGSRAHEMERDLPRGGAGIGAFNLVRRSAYERIGGHRLLRMDLVDDFKLGQILKESGARQRLYNGLDLVRCPWHRGARNVIRGLEKNFFSAFDYSLLLLTAATTLLATLTFGPAIVAVSVTALTWGSATPLLLTAAWVPLVFQAAAMLAGHLFEARRYGYSPVTLSLLHPLSIALLIVAAWNSAAKILARGGVRWRHTFYPLSALRAGLVRPGTGRSVGTT
jgi:glycosyltransferase involved in cell wall biosynthesis